MQQITLTVYNNFHGKRIDKFLSQELSDNYSRSFIQKLIKDENISILRQNESTKVLSYSHKLREDDVVTINIPPIKEFTIQGEDIPLNILYEDDDLIVINKEAGMVVHPGAGVYSGTLVNALLHHCKGSLSGISGIERPGIVHRLDKETSGVMVAAKNDIAHRELSKQFASRDIERAYKALVYGSIQIEGKIEKNIARHNKDRTKMAICRGDKGKYALTTYKRLKYFAKEDLSLVKCVLQTGRTHQIRVHMQSIDHALVGDKTYSLRKYQSRLIQTNKEVNDIVRNMKRHALHAYKLGFTHPSTKEDMLFYSHETDILKTLYETLEQSNS